MDVDKETQGEEELLVDLSLYVFTNKNEKIPATVLPMTDEDAQRTVTVPLWQTSWLSEFISDKNKEKYALKVGNELIGLAAYEILEKSIAVHLVYMESHPDSNPTMVAEKKYTGIGKALVAYGIAMSFNHGFGGYIMLEGKTPELCKHYLCDFHAMPLPDIGGAPRFAIDEDTASALIEEFVEEDSKWNEF